MNVDLTFNNSTGQREYLRVFFVEILKKALGSLSLGFSECGVSINVVSQEKMMQLNQKYRDKNQPTDVLSFPLHQAVDAIKKRDAIIELGDIFICLEVALKKTKESNRSLNDEVKFLVVHGLLHLLGYDHEKSPEDEKKMFSVQDRILAIV